ncbi:MAG: histidine phosphatase family protein [Levilactobacillus sp.]|uniref:histidine phosphatase family protein n=1 Tax=Levilactobacillus sp. TaxID=2767919 RepID=UPI00258F023C|nr:histidine phosphatase family protein [Levilactobacillus sp.]MCH4123137.1 histidine phosphatase family protein [Levilactobacillus sp.]MCI1552725.1 histidine phosphatase family protein [Levilactobacillus sp.]MCI1598975.1 histidine phosphatase family protein [Levilactobacillus sp.]MCI1606459.1 histidine phosphatase family protein [Levilactobacillus sp.]
MLKLYFIRHGKTQWNLEGRFQGAGGDSPLLPESYQQMVQVGQFLKDTPFTHAYASPIKRARVTAQHVIKELGQQVPLTLVSRLEEFHLGQMEGMAFDDVSKQFPAELDAFRNHPDQYDAAKIGGETFTQVIDRMTPAIQKIVAANAAPQDNVLIFSHGAALNAEINGLLGTPLADLRKRGGLRNTSVTILETQDGQHYDLVDWNDTSFLTAKPTATDAI